MELGTVFTIVLVVAFLAYQHGKDKAIEVESARQGALREQDRRRKKYESKKRWCDAPDHFDERVRAVAGPWDRHGLIGGFWCAEHARAAGIPETVGLHGKKRRKPSQETSGRTAEG